MKNKLKKIYHKLFHNCSFVYEVGELTDNHIWLKGRCKCGNVLYVTLIEVDRELVIESKEICAFTVIKKTQINEMIRSHIVHMLNKTKNNNNEVK
jgi:hypothetical protein